MIAGAPLLFALGAGRELGERVAARLDVPPAAQDSLPAASSR